MAWWRDWRKPAFLSAAILFQILLVAPLLRIAAVPVVAPALREVETILLFKPASKPAAPPPEQTRPPLRTPSQGPALYQIPKDWQAAPAHPQKGMNALLFDCAPQNLANLSPDELARCRLAAGHMAYDPTAVDFHDHTDRSQYAALWAMRRTRKNAPPLVPCASPQSVYDTLSTATLLCLAKFAASGFKLDALPGYGDPPPKSDGAPDPDAPLPGTPNIK